MKEKNIDMNGADHLLDNMGVVVNGNYDVSETIDISYWKDYLKFLKFAEVDIYKELYQITSRIPMPIKIGDNAGEGENYSSDDFVMEAPDGDLDEGFQVDKREDDEDMVGDNAMGVIPDDIIDEDFEIYSDEEIMLWLDGIRIEVDLTNSGLNNSRADYLLLTHLIICRCEYIFPEIWNKYDMSNKYSNSGTIVTSVSDSGTSVSSQLNNAFEGLDMNGQMYLMTRFGLEYLNYLKQINNLILVL